MNNKEKNDQADDVAKKLVAAIVAATKEPTDDDVMPLDLTDAIVDGDVTALFEGVLLASGYLYAEIIDEKADLYTMIDVFTRIAVARSLREQDVAES